MKGAFGIMGSLTVHLLNVTEMFLLHFPLKTKKWGFDSSTVLNMEINLLAYLMLSKTTVKELNYF